MKSCYGLVTYDKAVSPVTPWFTVLSELLRAVVKSPSGFLKSQGLWAYSFYKNLGSNSQNHGQ